MLVIAVAVRLLPSEAAGWVGGGFPDNMHSVHSEPFVKPQVREDKRTPRYTLLSCDVDSSLMRKNVSSKSFCVSGLFPGCVDYPATFAQIKIVK